MADKTALDTEILARCKAQFEAAACSPVYQKWQENAEEDFAFYEGKQWTDEEKQNVRDTPGTLRHTFASKLASISTEEAVIAKLLGHAPLNVTGRYAGKVGS